LKKDKLLIGEAISTRRQKFCIFGKWSSKPRRKTFSAANPKHTIMGMSKIFMNQQLQRRLKRFNPNPTHRMESASTPKPHIAS
jgi:hypothetical protein